MKQYSKKLFSLVALCSTVLPLLAVDANSVSPFIQFRSEGRDTARKLYGTIPYHVYLDDMDSCYGTFNATFQYDRSFRQKNLAEALFGNSLVSVPATTTTTPVTTMTNSCNSDCNREAVVVSGLGVATRVAATDLMAENFLLPEDFRSVLSFSPRVQNFLVDFNLYVGLDRWVKGMYFRLYGPVVSNKNTLRAEETITAQGTVAGSYAPGFFAPVEVLNTALYQNALSYFAGAPLTTLPAGITYQPLQYAKIEMSNGCNNNTTTTTMMNDCDDNHHGRTTGFAELRGEFGWNHIRENYHVGLNIQAAAPTGKRPNAVRLFENQVGNGKHWELGAGFMAGYNFWNSEDGDKSFALTIEADVTHLFHAKQTRTFDLKGRQLSRYMLAEQFSPAAVAPATTPAAVFGSATAGATAAGVQATSQFNGTYAPVANFSTRDVKVAIGAQGDVVAMFTYVCRGFTWDLGYNFWGMSCEKISCPGESDDCQVPFPTNWALKGDAQVYGFNETVTPFVTIPLSATEDTATIHAGTNAAAATALISPNQNPGVDNALFAQTTAAAGGAIIVNGTSALQVKTSIQPVFISLDDLDVEGAQVRGYSNKVFTHFNYSWVNRDRWVPYIGAGFSAEFGSHRGGEDCNNNSVTTTNSCSDNGCNSIGLSKWAVEVKGGVSFH